MEQKHTYHKVVCGSADTSYDQHLQGTNPTFPPGAMASYLPVQTW